MSRTRLLLSALAVAAVGAVAGVVIGQRSTGDQGPRGTSEIAEEQASAPERAPAFTPAQLSAPPTGWWITNGGDLSNRRYSPLNLIDSDNVAELRELWRTELEASPVANASSHSQPLFYAGVLYVTSAAGDVFAVDVEDGSIAWRNVADGRAAAGDEAWNGGVALGDGRVYVGRLDGSVTALDQGTGERVWRAQVGMPGRERIAAAPLFYGDRVFVGVDGEGIRGRVVALDARTGRTIWRFDATAGPFDTGGETWRSGEPLGAAVAQTPAVDPAAGQLYASTGTAWPPLDGSQREGDNLFTSSIVAVGVRDGAYAWHFQEVHHDIWGYDAHSPVVLLDVEVDGFPRKLAAQTGPPGWTYLIDRERGEPAAPAGDFPVPQDPAQRTSVSQPIPDYAPFFPAAGAAGVTGVTAEDVFDPRVVPVARGGVQRQPSSYNPVTGLLYLCGSGVVLGARGRTEASRASSGGVFGAWNPQEGTIEWEHRWPEPCWSGTVTTGGNLVFVGRNDGNLEAYDAETGERKWRAPTGAGANSTVTTFGWRGKQYVAFLAGGSAAVRSRAGNALLLFGLP